MTNALRIKIVTAGMIVAGTIAAAGDKIAKLPLPGWVTSAWPFIYGGALLFRELAHIFWPDIQVPTEPSAIAQVNIQTGPPAAALQAGGYPPTPKKL